MGILNRKPDKLEWEGALTVPIRSGMTWDLMQRMIEEGCVFHYRSHGILFEHASLWIGDIPKAKRPLCGARTRKGTPCQARALDGKSRCRLHGACPRVQRRRREGRASPRATGAVPRLDILPRHPENAPLL